MSEIRYFQRIKYESASERNEHYIDTVDYEFEVDLDTWYSHSDGE